MTVILAIVAATFGTGGFVAGALFAGVTRPGPLRDPDGGPVVLELEPVYPNGATGALHRVTLAELEADAAAGDELELSPPTGAAHLRIRLARRAGIYAGDTTTVERESEPPPAFLTGGRS